MKYRFFALCLALSIMATKQLGAIEPARPNILYFYVDDMGWGSIGPNGQAARRAQNLPSVRTPNLDALAAQGVNFTRGYGCHVCSPARSSLQTGFHQGHTFADRNDPDNARKAIRADDVSIGTALASVGYTTGYWGKWGYGGSKDQNNPTIDNIQTLPTSHGFQHVLAELHHVRAHTFFQPTLWNAPAPEDSVGGLHLIPNSMARYANSDAYPQDPALQNHANYPTTGYCDDAYAFAALDFVRSEGQSYNASGTPFIGILAVQIPHAPFDEIATLPDWDKAYADDPHFASLAKQSQQWAAMVTRIDAHFGNILGALEDPNNDGDTSDSIADNTLVIFQSDNGGPGGKSNDQFDANGGLSGVKGKIQEGGIRVPLIMRWPARINQQSTLKAGSDCDRVVDVTDLLPTFCELAGADIPIGIDGVSLAPTLAGEGQQRQRDFIIHEASNGHSIIRGNLKLVLAKKSGAKLYDLSNDPAESHDIAADRPQAVQELKTLLLGERVAEPKGFANTYHQWIGDNGATTSDAGNWSDYEYANAGVTYMTDDGPPQLSWIARIANSADQPAIARVDADLELLGLEVRGNDTDGATQSLVLAEGVSVTGLNEVRLQPNGNLVLNGGSLSSLRWIDIDPDAVLSGNGQISGDVYNDGTVELFGQTKPTLRVSGNFQQSSTGTLRVPLSGRLQVDGEVSLSGQLMAAVETGAVPIANASVVVLKAKRIVGTFANADDKVVADDGTRFSIAYSDTEVTLTRD